MVVEGDKDEQGRLHGFLVLAGKAHEVLIDVSRLGEGLVAVEAA